MALKAGYKGIKKVGSGLNFFKGLLTLAADIMTEKSVDNMIVDTVGWSSKNLLPLSLDYLKTINTSGVWADNVYTYHDVVYTVTVDSDGYVTQIALSGTATTTNGSSLFLLDGTPSWMNADDDYIMSGCPAGGQSSTYFIQYTNWAVGTTYAKYDFGEGEIINKIVDSDAQKMRIWIKKDCNTAGLVFKPMVRHASVIDPTFKPYHPNVVDEIAGVAVKSATFSGTTSASGNVLLSSGSSRIVIAAQIAGKVIVPYNTGGETPNQNGHVSDFTGAAVASTAVNGTYYYVDAAAVPTRSAASDQRSLELDPVVEEVEEEPVEVVKKTTSTKKTATNKEKG